MYARRILYSGSWALEEEAHYRLEPCETNTNLIDLTLGFFTISCRHNMDGNCFSMESKKVFRMANLENGFSDWKTLYPFEQFSFEVLRHYHWNRAVYIHLN